MCLVTLGSSLALILVEGDLEKVRDQANAIVKTRVDTTQALKRSCAGVSWVNPSLNAVATVDQKLNAKGYIIPGLGDAGDLAFGDKL